MDQNLLDKVTLSILSTVSFSTLAWDHCLLLSAEYQAYLYLKKSWRDPRPWLFVLLRYTGLAALFANMLMTAVRHRHCIMTSAAYRVFEVLVMTLFCVLVTLRVSVIWSYHPGVVGVLGLLSLTVVGLWIAVATQIRSIMDPAATLVSNCALRPFPSWFSSTYVAALAFNLAAFSLAAADILVKSSGTNRDKTKDFRFLAFLIPCIAASAAGLIILALGSAKQISKQSASGFFILLIVSMGSRIYLTFGIGERSVPLLFSPGRTPPGNSFMSWGRNTSTINQSIFTSLPGELSTAKTTAESFSTTESHIPSFGATLSPPSARAQLSNSSIRGGSSQRIHSSSPSEGPGSSARSQPKATGSSTPITVPQTTPILFRAEPSLTGSLATRRGARLSKKHNIDSGKGSPSTSGGPAKGDKQPPELQSGWIDS